MMSRKKRFKAGAASIALSLLLSLCACIPVPDSDSETETGGGLQESSTPEYEDESSGNEVFYSDFDGYTFGGPLGSAKELDGKTLVVSIFMDDINTSWNFDSQADDESRAHALAYLKIAADWITGQCLSYGKEPELICDWSQYPELYMEGCISQNLAGQNETDIYYREMEWIDENVPSQELMDEYGADNIFYMIFVNTEEDNETVSYTYNYNENVDYPYEVVSVFVYSEYEEETPAAYAHEILHTFGAPDLYMADTDGLNYGITQEYVDLLRETGSNDIMYTTYDAETMEAYYDHISNELSELDAYYVGITDHSKVQEEWGFDVSEHAK